MTGRFENLADDIVSSGVKAVFGIPGSGFTLDLIDKLENRGVPFFTTHFEGSAAIMAATMGSLNNSVGVSLSIKGPGLTNAIPGIASAFFESLPLIHIAEAFDDITPNHVAHKRIDQNELVSSISKGSFFLSDSGVGFKKCADLSKSETPGPVLLQIASNFNETGSNFNEFCDINYGRTNINQALDMISKAKKIIVIVGSLAVRINLKRILEKLHIPIFTTVAAKGIVDESRLNSAGVYTGVGLSLTPEYSLIQEADLIVGIGLCAKELLAVKKFPSPSINIEALETKGIDGFQFDLRVGLEIIDHLDILINAKEWGVEEISNIKQNLNIFIGNDFLPGSVFFLLVNIFGEKARFILDTGYFCTIGEHALNVTAPHLCLMSGQGRYMGTSLPMAIGASLSDINLINIVISGDGGIGMYISEIKIAVQYKLPLLIILMSDGGFGSIRTASIRKGITQKPLVCNNPSWVSVFNGFGVKSEICDSINSLQNILTKWDPSIGPTFIEINFPPDKYQHMIHNIR